MPLRRVFRRGAAAWAVVLSAALAFLGLQPAQANHSVSGTIQNACVTPATTSLGVTANGVCGFKFTRPAHLAHYRVTSSPGADLDIHFYNAAGIHVGANAGPTLVSSQCVDLVGTPPAGAVTAIIVLTPSQCGANANVVVTYTTET